MGIFDFFKRKPKRPISLSGVYERLTSGLIRAAKPSARAHDDFAGTSIDQSNNLLVTESERSRLRSWCKKEYLDNPLAHNIARNFAMGVYGAGPILQVHSPNDTINDAIETIFSRWRTASDMDWKFITAIQSLFYDGEAFFHFTPNPSVPGGIDIELLEARRIVEPYSAGFDPNRLEGITYNEYNQPVWYDVLEEHQNPNALNAPQTTIVPAEHIMHLYFEDVVNQKRGLPLLQSALEMLSSLRRITNASLGAWELAAKMNLVIQTGMDAYQFLQCMPRNYEEDGATMIEAFKTIPVPDDGGMTFLASGMSMNQVKNEHPNQAFTEHTETFQKIAGLAGGLPENLATGSSAKYNFASAKMDYQLFSRYAGACQQKLRRFLNNCVKVALRSLEGEGIESVSQFLAMYPEGTVLPLEWHFPNMLSSIDRSANATGDVQLLQAGLLTHREYCKRYGIDYEQHMRDWIDETKRINEAKAETQQPEAVANQGEVPNNEI